MACQCKEKKHKTSLVVLTGGPGAGKTATLQVASRIFCKHVSILPEAASIIFSGGFIRGSTLAARKGAQRAIFHVQRELEEIVLEENEAAIALCDRGTLDGLAYWPVDKKNFWADLETTKEKEYKRYAAVIHLRTPDIHNGYNHNNPIRLETAVEASKIDEKILDVWADHPNRFVVDSSTDFVEKVKNVLDILRPLIPKCCLNAKK
ncbi:MAG: ATP-binding protein [Bacteriovoracia bacterium]